MNEWPSRLFDLIFVPDFNVKLDELAELAEQESWEYQNTETDHHLPILYNYLMYTYKRLAEEDKILVSNNGQFLSFNTGLVTPNQEPIFAFCNVNRNEDAAQDWFFFFF